jgi:hypothetical protein
VIVGVIIGIAKHLGVPADHVFTKILEPWYCGICLTLAPLCLAGGCWLYVRRVEP